MSALGLPRVHHPVLDSTNERAKTLARAGAPHGTVVTADEQSAGRGRQGRAWVAPPGTALLMSLILRGLEDRRALLPLTAAVAVCEAAEASANVACAIKWPNDVWVQGRKLAGILIEARPHERLAVIGVGLNVATRSQDFPARLRSFATSLAIESRDGAPPRDAVLLALLRSVESGLGQEREQILERWAARDALRGSRISWDDGEGTAAGIDSTGALRVETDGGLVSLDAGEVHLRR